ncbi:hypothetical protein SDC9_190242 [bioreactor metagenome]|uniref:HTH cro/C1-type domain-containing protein n=1 Tax=bioreactor metagenome TaxID=1076179 RepID=A0A645HUF9_9ZZZZ|nr:helix-turn-helix transcriptional regulator [Lachnospiraceae bacterium]
MDYIQIGNKIRKFRVEKNFTQETFSEAIGISVSYWGQIERGQREASISKLESIAHALGVPLTALLSNLNEDKHISYIWRRKT